MYMLRITLTVAAIILFTGIGQGFAQIIEVDADIPAYSKVSGISGNIGQCWFRYHEQPDDTVVPEVQ